MTERVSPLEATRRLVTIVKNEPIVTSLGNPAYDLALAKDRPQNFYTWGSMGLASSIGLGLAIRIPDRKVFVLDGDGSLLMNLGSFATISSLSPPNLIHIIWDNEQHEITGRQQTATGKKVKLAQVAKGAGISKSVEVRTIEDFEQAVKNAMSKNGPHIIVVKTRAEHSKGRPPSDPVFIKHRFMNSI